MKTAFSFLLLSAAIGLSQPAAPAADISEKQLKLAQEIASAAGTQNNAELGFQGMLPMINNIAKRLNLDPQGSEELRGIYRAWFTTDLDHAKLQDDLAKSYATLFTEEELVQLKAFYDSPIGKKSVVTMPALMKDYSAASMEEAKSKQAKLQERLKPFLEKHPIPQQGGPGAPGGPTMPGGPGPAVTPAPTPPGAAAPTPPATPAPVPMPAK